jgi:hypothetical protein
MKRFTFFTLFAVAGALLLVSCGAKNPLGYNSAGGSSTLILNGNSPGDVAVGGTPTTTVLPGDEGSEPHVQVVIPQPSTDPADNPPSDQDPPPSVGPPETSDPSPADNPDGDDDHDGVKNGDDHLPEVCTSMRVLCHEVTSAWIDLNGVEAIAHNELKCQNTDSVFDVSANLAAGSNEISVKIAGKKESSITVQLWNCSKSPAEKIFEVMVIRTTASPNEASGTF